MGANSGYHPCPCRDCFETAIGEEDGSPSLCHECEEAGCDASGDSECERDPEPTEPEEEDWVTDDHRTFRQVGNPRNVVTVPDDADWRVIMSARMKADGFWPNVWFVSDHGNAHLLTMVG